jgi:hypothetical protein
MSRRRRDTSRSEYFDNKHDRNNDRRLDRCDDSRRSSRNRTEEPICKSRAPYRSFGMLGLLAISLLFAGEVDALHHLQEPAIHYVAARDSNRPLTVTNECPEVIYPGILTVSGMGPAQSGFRLNPGQSVPQTVSADWRGRVWGRTNCTFNSDGSPASGSGGVACETGDCGQFVQCQGAVSWIARMLHLS